MTDKNKMTVSWIINLVILVLNSLATLLNPDSQAVAMNIVHSFIG